MTFKEQVYQLHDVGVNQKYAGIHPYSFHLECVLSQGKKFLHLIPNDSIVNVGNSFSKPESVHTVVEYALTGHDLIEDARQTYNDIVEVCGDYLGNSIASRMVADMVYCVTDEKGKNREERKNAKYYNELRENKLAVFVKLSDIAANTLYSKLTVSTMYDKYKKEFVKFKELCWIEDYKPFFEYVEGL